MTRHKSKILLVTETPPGTPNGFGVTLQCLFQDTKYEVLFTDAAFKEYGEKLGYTLAHVPFHKSKKFFIPFKLGKIPEWRGSFSKKWLLENSNGNHSKVYAFVYSVECLLYAHWISIQKNIPLLIHLADHSDAFEQPRIAKILMACSKLVCITEDMKTKYESMLGRNDIKVLHNGAETQCSQLARSTPPPFNDKNPFILCFLGGLFSHLHGDCIEDFFKAVEQIRKQRPGIEFHLYGQRQPDNFLNDLLNKEGITHHGIVMPLEKKFEIMGKAHCFIIPSSFNPKSHHFYRYSFPTKLPELILSGRPIVSYGPSNTATNRILKSHKIGIRIHNRSVDALIIEILKTIDHLNLKLQDKCEYSSQTKHFFSASSAREKLIDILKV